MTTTATQPKIIESIDGPELYYLRAEFPATGLDGILNKGNVDDVEFKLIPDEGLVTYRSASREVFYLYPLQRPVDIGNNKKRLERIRLDLGWEELESPNLE